MFADTPTQVLCLWEGMKHVAKGMHLKCERQNNGNPTMVRRTCRPAKTIFARNCREDSCISRAKDNHRDVDLV